MDLTQFPYYADPYKEYYDKKYKKLIGIPGRVLQAREVTDLSFFPYYALKDVSDIFYYNSQIMNGLKSNEIDKISHLLNSLGDVDQTEVVEF